MPRQAVKKFYRNMLPTFWDRKITFLGDGTIRFLQNVVLTNRNTWHKARQVITTLRAADLTITQGCLSVLRFSFPVIVTEILGISIISG